MCRTAMLGACGIAAKVMNIAVQGGGTNSKGGRCLLPAAAARWGCLTTRPAATADPAATTYPQQQAKVPAGNEQQPESRFEHLIQNVRLTSLAQELCSQVLRPGDMAVDATCGNGHDTAFLAAAVGSSGAVHAFDVQPAAIEATQQRVAAAVAGGEAPVLHCHLASHAEMLQHVGSACARVIMFNLGYLPGSDKGTTTQEGSTLAAVQAASYVLQPGGLCSILCYIKHPGGKEEYEAVKALVEALPPTGWVSSEVRLLNRPTAPVLLLLWRRM